ncbi:DUF4928 family protein, partial [Azospirillum sp. A23]|uniref:DUF4928 family protein n=1 Tax=Azospirillum sp. A23 TaxID=3160608 RepID=UPI0036F2D7EB
LEAVEAFWVARVNDFFAAKPFSIKLDGNLSLRSVVRNLMAQAEARQKEVPGVMFLGTMMQHLVGAKLDIVIGPGAIVHHGSNQNDAADGRTGDFDICDVSIHVSTAPSEALIRKCRANIDAGLKPIIVSTRKGVVVAEGLSDNAGIGDRVDVIEFEQFIATNIYEIGKFVPAERRATVEGIIARYNEIVSAHETDPSLRIELAPGR